MSNKILKGAIKIRVSEFKNRKNQLTLNIPRIFLREAGFIDKNTRITGQLALYISQEGYLIMVPEVANAN